MAAGSNHSGRPKAMSEPAAYAATCFPDHELRSRALRPRHPGFDLSTPTRFAELASIGLWPIRAFTIGALVAVPLGHALSTTVLSDHRARI